MTKGSCNFPRGRQWQKITANILEQEVFPAKRMIKVLEELEARSMFEAWIAGVAGDDRLFIERMNLVDMARDLKSSIKVK